MKIKPIFMGRPPGILVFFVLILLIACNQNTGNKNEWKGHQTTSKGFSAIYDSLKLKKPTIHWKQLMKEGEGPYTPENIRASDELLDKYLDNLLTAKDSAGIMKAVEAVVKGFDKISIAQQNFIETVEREELAEFIQNAAAAFGLKYDGDITEQWRMEW